jgi:hypothetical protein
MRISSKSSAFGKMVRTMLVAGAQRWRRAEQPRVPVCGPVHTSVCHQLFGLKTQQKQIGAKLAISVSARAQGYKHPFAVET